MKHFDYKKYKRAQTRLTKFFNVFEEYQIGDTPIEMFDRTQLNAMSDYLIACADVNKNHHGVVTDEFTEFYLDLNK